MSSSVVSVSDNCYYKAAVAAGRPHTPRPWPFSARADVSVLYVLLVTLLVQSLTEAGNSTDREVHSFTIHKKAKKNKKKRLLLLYAMFSSSSTYFFRDTNSPSNHRNGG